MLKIILYFIFPSLSLSGTFANVLTLKDDNFNKELAKNPETLIMFHMPWCRYSQELLPIFQNAARRATESSKATTFAEVNCSEDGKRTCAKLNIFGYPTLQYYKNGKFIEEYLGRGADEMLDYVKEMSGGNIRHIYKRALSNISSSYPQSGTSPNFRLGEEEEDIWKNIDNVGIVNEKSFNNMVMHNNKDTFLEFYAPWCPHCKDLEPELTDLSVKLKNENVAVLKMDATNNKIPFPFDVTGYPTLYWIGKNEKMYPIKYDGSRNADDMLKYIASHASEELKGFDRNGNTKPVTKRTNFFF